MLYARNKNNEEQSNKVDDDAMNELTLEFKHLKNRETGNDEFK